MLRSGVDISVSIPIAMFPDGFMNAAFAVVIGGLPKERMDDGRFLLIFLGGFFLILAFMYCLHTGNGKDNVPKIMGKQLIKQ